LATTTIKPTEAVVQRQVCQHIRFFYPTAIFNSDGAGNYLSRAQAGMNKVLRSSSGYPDLFIAEPRGQYHGMFLELKRDGIPIYLKNGDLTSNPHVRAQAEILAQLRARGYWADFAVGADEAKELIDAYFSGKI
jgi:hypothetical protein